MSIWQTYEWLFWHIQHMEKPDCRSCACCSMVAKLPAVGLHSTVRHTSIPDRLQAVDPARLDLKVRLLWSGAEGGSTARMKGCAVRLADGLTGFIASISPEGTCEVQPWSRAGQTKPIPAARSVVRQQFSRVQGQGSSSSC